MIIITVDKGLTPSGIQFPATSAPPFGTFLGLFPGVEGYILMLSFSAANSIGIPAKDSKVTSLSVSNFALISACNCFAGNQSLVDIIPLFAGLHLSFLADMLGFYLGTYRRVHLSAGLISFALLLFHILSVAVQRTSFSLSVPEHLYGMILCPLSLLTLLGTDRV